MFCKTLDISNCLKSSLNSPELSGQTECFLWTQAFSFRTLLISLFLFHPTILSAPLLQTGELSVLGFTRHRLTALVAPSLAGAWDIFPTKQTWVSYTSHQNSCQAPFPWENPSPTHTNLTTPISSPSSWDLIPLVGVIMLEDNYLFTYPSSAIDYKFFVGRGCPHIPQESQCLVQCLTCVGT